MKSENRKVAFELNARPLAVTRFARFQEVAFQFH